MARTLKERELDRDRRNLRPHAEARLAMCMWSHEYAHEQRGGSMDFWDRIGEQRRKLCVQVVDDVLRDFKENGRAPLPNGE